ncbi:MAG: metal transporter [Proteobacteria bacterium]|nr:metal transporter [Pseudomonadota bacterium]
MDADTPTRRSRLLWLLMPLSLLVAAIAWFVITDPLQGFGSDAPAVENLTFERTVLDDEGLHLLVRAGGSEPMTIAQVQVDAAYWRFTQTPEGEIARGSAVWLDLPFPWMLGEAHVVTVVSNFGTTFEHEIEVAVPTPKVTASQLRAQALIGFFVGVLPIVFGLMFYPVLRDVGRDGMNFLLALTVGLLVFLLIDTVGEAFELAADAAAIFQGPVMVVLAGITSFFILMAVGQRGGAPSGMSLATFIALGIGLHNFGEGLAIGAAFAAGSAGLGTYLILGFTLHNITEGIGIAAPILKKRPPLLAFAGLALLAGGPAVIGMWMGSLAFSAHWAAFALAIGAGAIFQVVIQVGAYLMRRNDTGIEVFYTRAVMAGLAVGVIFMYATAALVKI